MMKKNPVSKTMKNISMTKMKVPLSTNFSTVLYQGQLGRPRCPMLDYIPLFKIHNWKFERKIALLSLRIYIMQEGKIKN